MGISTDEVAAVWEFMKTRLNPHPAQGYADTHARERDTRKIYVTPDAVIKRGEDGFEVEIVESRRFRLRINPVYTQLHAELRRASSTLSAEESSHIREYVTRARFFLYNLEQRYQTLHRVTARLAECQADFLERGVRYLRPLSRSQLADELGIHESTVSRATAGKHVLLPSGEVIPYSHFFTPSLSIKDVMKEMIDGEQAPLTDSQIAARLRERGILIARRTVAKYRKQLAILPSGMR
jgi:RNA polymerase sigma-54 factor